MTFDIKSNHLFDLKKLYEDTNDDQALLDSLKITVKRWRRLEKTYKILK